MSTALTTNTEMIATRFPRRLAEELRRLTGHKRRSQFIVEAVEEKLNQENQRRNEQMLDAQAA
jgi:metal-responsive CopG/Arc/MetJ family transcriptional regulator